MQYATDTKNILLSAAAYARVWGHSYVGSAHILLSMIRTSGPAGQLLRYAGLEGVFTETVIGLLYGRGTPDMPLHQGYSGQARRILRAAGNEARLQRSK